MAHEAALDNDVYENSKQNVGSFHPGGPHTKDTGFPIYTASLAQAPLPSGNDELTLETRLETQAQVRRAAEHTAREERERCRQLQEELRARELEMEIQQQKFRQTLHHLEQESRSWQQEARRWQSEAQQAKAQYKVLQRDVQGLHLKIQKLQNELFQKQTPQNHETVDSAVASMCISRLANFNESKMLRLLSEIERCEKLNDDLNERMKECRRAAKYSRQHSSSLSRSVSELASKGSIGGSGNTGESVYRSSHSSRQRQHTDATPFSQKSTFPAQSETSRTSGSGKLPRERLREAQADRLSSDRGSARTNSRIAADQNGHRSARQRATQDGARTSPEHERTVVEQDSTNERDKRRREEQLNFSADQSHQGGTPSISLAQNATQESLLVCQEQGHL